MYLIRMLLVHLMVLWFICNSHQIHFFNIVSHETTRHSCLRHLLNETEKYLESSGTTLMLVLEDVPHLANSEWSQIAAEIPRYVAAPFTEDWPKLRDAQWNSLRRPDSILIDFKGANASSHQAQEFLFDDRVVTSSLHQCALRKNSSEPLTRGLKHFPNAIYNNGNQSGFISRNPVPRVRQHRSVRLTLSRVLSVLRSSSLWQASTLFLLPLASPDEASDAQRAFGRWGAPRAVVWTPLGLQPLRPFRRPHRPPPVASLSRTLNAIKRRVDWCGTAITLAVYISTPSQEIACGNGIFPPIFMSDIARYMANWVGARPLCYSVAGQMVGMRGPNGVRRGLSVSVVRGRADLLIFSFGGDPDGDKELDYFYPHDVENTCLFVRAAAPKPFLQGLVYTVTVKVWLATLGTLVAVWAAMVLARRRGPVGAAADVFRAFLWGQFRTKGKTAVLVLGLGVTYLGMVLNTGFYSRVTSSLSIPYDGHQMNTLKEVVKRLRVVHSNVPLITASSSDEPELAALARLVRLQYDRVAMRRSVNRVIQHVDEGVVLTDFSADFMVDARIYRDAQGRRMLHKVEECIATDLPASYTAHRNSPFLHDVDLVQRLANEAGILTHLSAIMDRERRRFYNMVPPEIKRSRRQPPERLALRHLSTVFVIWGSGMAAGVGALVAECAVGIARRWLALSLDRKGAGVLFKKSSRPMAWDKTKSPV